MQEGFIDKSDAIIAALDEMEEGDMITVHEEICPVGVTKICSCNPQIWTY